MEYGKFRVGDLFKVINNPQLDKRYFKFGNEYEYPYFTRTENNNGVLGYVDYLDEKHKIRGNSLAVGMISMRFHYMSHDFYAGQFTKTLIPLFDGFNESIALYFIAELNARSAYYQGYLVREFAEKVSNTELRLPVTPAGEPDFEYMVERICELEAERIRELEAYLIASGLSDVVLTDDDKAVLAEFGEREFEFFRIGDLFEKLDVPYYGSGKRNSDVVGSRDAEHCVPVTTAKRGNNGICRWARKGAFKTYENVISVVTNGAIATGLVYYQPDEVSSLVDSYLLGLKADGMNERVGLFLACAMQKVLYPKYTRDNKAYWSCVQDDEIQLPATLDGTPDFAFMAAYVGATEKLAIQDAIRLKDDVIAATKAVASS